MDPIVVLLLVFLAVTLVALVATAVGFGGARADLRTEREKHRVTRRYLRRASAELARVRERGEREIERAERLQRELHELQRQLEATPTLRPEPEPETAPVQSPQVVPAKEEPPVLRELVEASRGLHPDIAARVAALGADWAQEDALEAIEELHERNGRDWTRTNAQLATGAGGLTL